MRKTKLNGDKFWQKQFDIDVDEYLYNDDPDKQRDPSQINSQRPQKNESELKDGLRLPKERKSTIRITGTIQLSIRDSKQIKQDEKEIEAKIAQYKFGTQFKSIMPKNASIQFQENRRDRTPNNALPPIQTDSDE